VNGDGSIELKRDMTMEDGSSVNLKDATSFKVFPHVDQSKMFGAVSEHLKKGGAVGIFPEGGSHDRSDLLDLKVGIAIMALDTIAKHPDCNVKIVPVGLNYFHGHRFRSRVFVEFGDALSISDDLIEQYKKGGEHKRAACGVVLEDILQGLGNVTVLAPTQERKELFKTFQRLYVPKHAHKSAQEKQDLLRAFSEGFEKYESDSRIVKLTEKVQHYNSLLSHYGVTDYQVQGRLSNAEDVMGKPEIVSLLAWRVMLLLIYILCFIPGGLAALPFTIVAKLVADMKRKEALAKSSVKLKALDVLATWKILVGIVFVPTLHFFYTMCMFVFYGSSAAIVYFFFMPFVSAASIMAFENFRRVLLSLKPLWLLLHDGSGTKSLAAMREQCKDEVRQLADLLEWVPEESEVTPRGESLSGIRLLRNSSGLDVPKAKSKSWLSGPSYDWWASTPDY